MFEGARQVEAEIVRAAQNAVGANIAWSDGQHLAQDSLLLVFGHGVVEDGQDVALLAKLFLVRIVGEQAAFAVPAFAGEARAHMCSAVLVAGGEYRVAKGLFEIGGIVQRAEVLKRRYAGFAICVVGGDGS